MGKRLLRFLIVLLVFAAFNVFLNQYDNITEHIEIYKDRLTQAEAADFEAETAGKSMYYYNQLNEEEQQVYQAIYSMLSDFTDSRHFEITKEQLTRVLYYVSYDNSNLFWVNRQYTYIEHNSSIEFIPSYRMTESEAQDYERLINQELDKIISGAEGLETDYEKELYFNDYLCENVVYVDETIDEWGNNLIGTLIEGEAICEGYARTMQVLLERSGIYNYLVLGDGKTEDGTEAHIWNIVNINGENYHLDVTWNDTLLENEASYLYFNVNDSYISYDHFNLEPADNSCTSFQYNYFVQKGLYVESFEGYDFLADSVAEELRQGDSTVEILFADGEQLNKAIDYMDSNNNRFFDFIKKCVNKSGNAFVTDNIEYYTIDGMNCLFLIFKEG